MIDVAVMDRTLTMCRQAIGVTSAGVVAAAVVLVSGHWLDAGARRQPIESNARLVPQPAPEPADHAIGRPGAGEPRVLAPAPGARSRLLAIEQRKAGLETVATAAEAQGQHADSVLADLAIGHADVAVREEAIHELGERGGALAARTLQQAIQDPQPRVREAAVRALADVGTDEAVRILGGALSANDATLRLDAVEALGEIGSRDAERYLRQVLGDESPPVREAAAQWLDELSP